MIEDYEHPQYKNAEVLEALREEFAKSFPDNDLLCVYHNGRSGILDLMGIINKEGSPVTEFGGLERFSAAIARAAETLGEKKKYLFAFNSINEMNFMECLLRYYLALDKKCGLEKIETVPLHFLFYHNLNDFVEKANFDSGLHYLSAGKLLIGEDKERLNRLSENQPHSNKGNKSVTGAELFASGSYIKFLANANLPYQILAKMSIITLKAMVMEASEVFLWGNYNIHCFSIKDLFRYKDKFPESVNEAVGRLQEIRSMKGIAQKDEIIGTYRKCIKAINEIRVFWV